MLEVRETCFSLVSWPFTSRLPSISSSFSSSKIEIDLELPINEPRKRFSRIYSPRRWLLQFNFRLTTSTTEPSYRGKANSSIFFPPIFQPSFQTDECSRERGEEYLVVFFLNNNNRMRVGARCQCNFGRSWTFAPLSGNTSGHRVTEFFIR